MQLLKDFSKPVIIISNDPKGASYMTQGLGFSHTFYMRFPISEYGDLKTCLEKGIEWAEGIINQSIAYNKENLPWL